MNPFANKPHNTQPPISLWLAACINLFLAASLVTSPVLVASDSIFLAVVCSPASLIGLFIGVRQMGALFHRQYRCAEDSGYFAAGCALLPITCFVVYAGRSLLEEASEDFWTTACFLFGFLLASILFAWSAWINLLWAKSILRTQQSIIPMTWQFTLAETAFGLIFLSFSLALMNYALPKPEPVPIPFSFPEGATNIELSGTRRNFKATFNISETEFHEWIENDEFFEPARAAGTKLEDIEPGQGWFLFHYHHKKQWIAVEWDRRTGVAKMSLFSGH